MSDEETIDLAALADDDLVKQMHDDLYDGLAEEIAEGTQILLDRGWGADRVLNDALVEGMRIVGIDFRDGILFVPEVLLAANAMKAGMALLRPLLAETGASRVGKVVIGTVKGDIHDIGKNLVAMMLEGAGFEVFDLGVNNPVERYLEALEEHKPDILGMSALLTTTMPYMKVVIEELEKQGIRGDYIVLVGGAPLNEDFGKAIGADAYCRDAAVAAETASALVLARRAVARLPGDHCYAFLAGVDGWLAMHEAEPATFYLTDFLARHFERFVVQGLGLDRHPELLRQVFGNYRRVVYLAQADDPSLVGLARVAAASLSLPLEIRRTGFGDLAPSLAAF